MAIGILYLSRRSVNEKQQRTGRPGCDGDGWSATPLILSAMLELDMGRASPRPLAARCTSDRTVADVCSTHVVSTAFCDASNAISPYLSQ
ncbi:hypothetical protein IWW51_003430 [Coemansia sp. RSA 2702]|nr:hypothetical protein IWW51_003430 [Coemansia sp. RSA 2702]